MAFDGNPHIFADHAPAQQPLVPGYTQGHLPHAIVDDTRLNLAALFLLSYRVRHSPGWGTEPARTRPRLWLWRRQLLRCRQDTLRPLAT